MPCVHRHALLFRQRPGEEGLRRRHRPVDQLLRYAVAGNVEEADLLRGAQQSTADLGDGGFLCRPARGGNVDYRNGLAAQVRSGGVAHVSAL